MSGAGASASSSESGRDAKRARVNQDSEPAAGPKHRVFAVYTYKGGAGKTTTIINISSVLATEFHKKVLLVDCDPQCNLTSFFLPDKADDLDVNSQAGDLEEGGEGINQEQDGQAEVIQGVGVPFIKHDRVDPGAQEMDLKLFRDANGFINPDKYNVFRLLQGCMDNGVPDFDADEVCSKLEKAVEDEEGGAGGVWMLKAIPRIVTFEKVMANSNQPWVQMIKYGLRRAIDKMCAKGGYEYVFLDFGPSASELNMTWVSSCDFIIPVAFPDFFNVASLDGLLSEVLPGMLEKRRNYINFQQEDNLRNMVNSYHFQDLSEETKEELKREFTFKTNPPTLLPVIVTNYRGRIKGTKPKPAQEDTRLWSMAARSSSWVKTMQAMFDDRPNFPIKPEVKAIFMPSGGVDGRRMLGENMVCPLTQTFNNTQQISHQMGFPIPLMFRRPEALQDRCVDQRRETPQHLLVAERAHRAFKSLCEFLMAPGLDA